MYIRRKKKKYKKNLYVHRNGQFMRTEKHMVFLVVYSRRRYPEHGPCRNQTLVKRRGGQGERERERGAVMEKTTEKNGKTMKIKNKNRILKKYTYKL